MTGGRPETKIAGGGHFATFAAARYTHTHAPSTSSYSARVSYRSRSTVARSLEVKELTTSTWRSRTCQSSAPSRVSSTWTRCRSPPATTSALRWNADVDLLECGSRGHQLQRLSFDHVGRRRDDPDRIDDEHVLHGHRPHERTSDALLLQGGGGERRHGFAAIG